ncbi:hypothetical protein AVEN_68797-1 [Araneus ventricosus]|uniref:long-chain-fatty-acid--CoA ligase n=1 Tax=Araneus ventricosus TaxID=182803 RepID=A0A4Y2C5T1_ARAVE|nr:hypothetical protein AVEN_68797-1 [Araneus ventricosus]
MILFTTRFQNIGPAQEPCAHPCCCDQLTGPWPVWMEKSSLTKEDTTLSYLPLAHIFGQFIHVLFLMNGASIGFFSGDTNQLLEDIKILQPTVLPAVPRLLNKWIRGVDAAVYRRRIKAETPAQYQALRERYAEAHHLVRDRQSQRIRDKAIHFIEAQVETHNCGPMNIIWQFRETKNFAAERPSDGKFTSCCRKGKIKLEKPSDALSNVFLYPNFLLDLLTNPNNPDYKIFSR